MPWFRFKSIASKPNRYCKLYLWLASSSSFVSSWNEIDCRNHLFQTYSENKKHSTMKSKSLSWSGHMIWWQLQRSSNLYSGTHQEPHESLHSHPCHFIRRDYHTITCTVSARGTKIVTTIAIKIPRRRSNISSTPVWKSMASFTLPSLHRMTNLIGICSFTQLSNEKHSKLSRPLTKTFNTINNFHCWLHWDIFMCFFLETIFVADILALEVTSMWLSMQVNAPKNLHFTNW